MLKRIIIFLFLIIIITLLTIFSSRSNREAIKTSISRVVTSPIPTKNPSDASGLVFENAFLPYTLNFPEGWKGIEGPKGQYPGFAAITSDYKISSTSPSIISGAEITIIGKDMTKKNVEDQFKSDPVVPEIAQNKRYSKVDGQKAIQFDYILGETTGTQTVFIEKGKYYVIKFIYPNLSTKEKYWPDYQGILESFKGK
ncbi:hypothetical protein M1307_02160 [Patescibacteria group bacterium]|nr:hypothetical protein [Patescibacteria group bacterium]